MACGPIVLELRHALGELRQTGEDVEIDADLLFDAGVLHLHHHRFARLERGGVHLADRRRGQRLLAEPGKQLFQRLAQLAFDHRPHRLGRISRRVFLQLLQLLGQRQTDQVGPRAEHLAQLDERRPELRERQPDARLGRLASQRISRAALEELLGELQIELGHPTRQAVLAEHGEDLNRPIEIAIDLRDGGDFHDDLLSAAA